MITFKSVRISCFYQASLSELKTFLLKKLAITKIHLCLHCSRCLNKWMLIKVRLDQWVHKKIRRLLRTRIGLFRRSDWSKTLKKWWCRFKQLNRKVDKTPRSPPWFNSRHRKAIPPPNQESSSKTLVRSVFSRLQAKVYSQTQDSNKKISSSKLKSK